MVAHAREAKGARLIELGRKPYREALALQREIHTQVARGEAADTWIIVEHDPVITLGRNAKRENLLVPESTLAARGIDVVEVERGGDVTYHGPGQIVVYPIVRLARFREVVPFVSALESTVIDALRCFGIAGDLRHEHRGVYVGTNAICAIGLAVKQMTTLHGLALNVDTELDYNQCILPCGTRGLGITSVSQQCGIAINCELGREALIASIERTFDTTLRRSAVGIAGSARQAQGKDPSPIAAKCGIRL